MAEYLIQDTTLTGIADAIRSKDGTTDAISVNDMANKISAIETGLRRLVTNDTSITPTGTYASSTYYNTSYGVKIGYMADGNILLSMKGGTTTSYEKLHFTLASAPTGVSIEIGSSTNSNATGSAALIYACVLKGITTEVSISIAMNSINSSSDYTTCAITVTAI